MAVTKQPPVELDLDTVFHAAEATGAAFEVNGALPRLDLSVGALRKAKSYEAHLVLTSDAHHTRELASIDYATLNAERAGVDPARVVNTWEVDRLRAWALGI